MAMRNLLLTFAFVAATLSVARSAKADDANTRYGAIAWSSSTGATGAASHYLTQGLAEAAAESNCGQADCATQISGADDFPMAIAKDPSGSVYTNWGHTWPELRDNLLADCQAYSGRTCRIVQALPL